MDIMDKWNTADWLENARDLVSWADSVPPDNSILLLLRHSHRVTLNTYDEMVNAGLTELGKKLSFQFGQHIPSHRSTRIFFSFVSRCYETAEEIRKALIERGATIDEFEPLATIVGPQNAKDVVWKNLEPDGNNVTEFVNWWANREFGDDMEPFDEYVQRLGEDTLRRIKDDPRGVFHIHITHDLCLMSAKRSILGRPLRKEDREPYLGGVGFQVGEDDIYFYNQGTTSKIPNW